MVSKNKYFYTIILLLMVLVLIFTIVIIYYKMSNVGSFYLEIKQDSDYDGLINSMSVNDFVLLGESTHGTQEFYEIRSIISKRLIEEHGFKFIVVEGDWSSIYKINLYVKHLSDEKDITIILEKFDRWPTWMWANQEIKELAEWLREYNKNLDFDEMIGIYGFDVYGVENSLKIVEDLSDFKYECLSDFIDDFSGYAHFLSLGNNPCNDETKEIFYEIKYNQTIKNNFNDEEYFNLKQNAFVVKNAEIHYRAMVYPQLSSWNERVIHMDKTLEKLMDLNNGKVIIWAHNTHVGDARATDMNGHMINLGQLLREANQDVFILGFSTYKGEVLAGRYWGSPMEIMKIPPANENSYESIFNEFGINKGIIYLKNEKLPAELKEISHNRAIGVVYNPEFEYPGNYVRTKLNLRYDAIIFIRNTNKLNTLS